MVSAGRLEIAIPALLTRMWMRPDALKQARVQLIHQPRIGYVELLGGHRPALLRKRLAGALRRVAVHVGQDDGGAGLAERVDDR